MKITYQKKKLVLVTTITGMIGKMEWSGRLAEKEMLELPP